jgi:hypothetical protein
MNNPALEAFFFRIASNNLTAKDIAALTTALQVVIPTFPNPDETSTALFSDEGDAREWIAALYTIQANGETTVSANRVVTPNPITELTVPFAPGAGKVLLVADITPQSSGLLLVSVNLGITEDAAGVPAFLIAYVDLLTAVTGGTLIAPGLTEEPTSTTPAFTAGVGVFAVENPSFNDGTNPHEATLTAASVPVQAVVGHRTGIIVVAKDTGAQNWTAISASVSVVEL